MLIDSVQLAGAGTSSAINTTGADFLVAVISGAIGPAISDSKGNTWHELTMQIGSFSSETSIWYAYNPTVGSGHTFTASGEFPGMCVAAFSGRLTSGDPFDVENGAVEGPSPRQAGSVTPSQDGELLIAGLGGTPSPISIDSGFTIAESMNLTGGVNYGCVLAYLEQGTAGALNPSWTFSGSGAAVIATFKAAAGGGGAFARFLSLLFAG